MGKKITSLMLALIMVMTMLPLSLVTAAAATPDGKSEGTAWWIADAGAEGASASDIKAWLNGSGDNYTLNIKCNKDGASIKDYQENGSGVAPWHQYTASITSLSIYGKKINKIGKFAFIDCARLTSVSMPTGLTKIGDAAFKNCSALRTLTLNSQLTSIGGASFFGCASLTSLRIPASVTSITTNTFKNCSDLTEVVFEGDTISIGSNAFTNCSKLQKVTFERLESADDINELTFTNVGTEEAPCALTFPADGTWELNAGVQDWKGGKFRVLGSWKVGESVTAKLTSNGEKYTLTLTGTGAMGDKEKAKDYPWASVKASITSLNLDSRITHIGDYAFSGCNALQSVALPSALESIGYNAFNGCSGLIGTLTIPAGVTNIGYNAFKGCASLTDVTFNGPRPEIQSNVFAGVGTAAAPAWLHVTKDWAYDAEDADLGGGKFVPLGVWDIGDDADNNITAYLTQDYKLFVSGTGAMQHKDPWPWAPVAGKIKSISIGNGITSICDNAFAGLASATSLSVPGSLTAIGANAFKNCVSLSGSLSALPAGLTTLGTGAFEGCSSLIGAVIPASVTSIGADAFKNCTGLTSVTISEGVKTIGASAFAGCKKLNNVAIPETVTTIGNGAFWKTGLTAVELPAGINTIGVSAFEGCNGLTELYVPAGVTGIGDRAFANTGLKKVYFDDAKPTTYGNDVFAGVSGDMMLLTYRWGDDHTDDKRGGTFTNVYYTPLYKEFSQNSLTYYVTDVEELVYWDEQSTHANTVKITDVAEPVPADYYEITATVTYLRDFTVAAVANDAFAGVGTQASPMMIRLPDSWVAAENYPQGTSGAQWNGGYLVLIYVVTFDRNDADSEERSALAEDCVVYTTTAVKPDMPQTKSVIVPAHKEGKKTIATKTDIYEFAGWYYTENSEELPWNFGTPVTSDVTLTAHWLNKSVKQAQVTGKVVRSSNPVANATVELWKGNMKIGAAMTNSNGGFEFDSVEAGYYEIRVTTADGLSSASYMVQVVSTKDDICSFTLSLPTKNVFTTVTLDAGSSSGLAMVNGVVVEGLDKVAAALDTGAQLKFSLTTEGENTIANAAHRQIRKLAGNKKTLEFFDITLMNGSVDLGKTNSVRLAIHIPFNTASATNIVVYRCHDENNNGSVVDHEETYAMKLDPAAGEEGFVVNKGEVVIYAKKFSTYAIGYGAGNGTSGNSSSGSSYYTSEGKSFTTSFTGINAVYVDGKPVNSKYYTVSGSTVTLSQEFLATLSNGTHTFNAQSNTMQGKATFTVRNGKAVNSVRTGDIGVFPYVALSFVVIALGAVTVMRRKEERY